MLDSITNFVVVSFLGFVQHVPMVLGSRATPEGNRVLLFHEELSCRAALSREQLTLGNDTRDNVRKV